MTMRNRRSSSQGMSGVESISITDADDDYMDYDRGRRSSSSKTRTNTRRRRNSSTEKTLTKSKADREQREEDLRRQGKEVTRKRRSSRKTETSTRKNTSESDEPKTKRKRRRRTTGELISSGKTRQAQKRLDKLSSKTIQLTESFDVDPDDVLPPIVSTEFTTEKEFLEEYEHIYETQSTIIRRLEERLTDRNSSISSRDIYALSAMYSQMRETIADMRSIKDMNAQAEALAIEVFDPAMKAAGESLVAVYFKITTMLRQHVKDVSAIEIILEKLKQDIAAEGVDLQNQLIISRSKILETLSEG